MTSEEVGALLCVKTASVHFLLGQVFVLQSRHFQLDSFGAIFFFQTFFHGHFPTIMANVDASSHQEFDNIIDEFVARRDRGLGEDNQSDDISVLSSVRTGELSDFSAGEISSSDTDEVDEDAEWPDTVKDED